MSGLFASALIYIPSGLLLLLLLMLLYRRSLCVREPAPPGLTVPKLFMSHRLHFSEEYLTKYTGSDLTDDIRDYREK